METANAERPIGGTYEENNGNGPDIQLPLSVECSDKSSYEQGSPPICYVDLGGHRSIEPDFREQQSADSHLCDSPPEITRDDRVSESKEADKADPPIFNAIVLNSAEQSSLIVKDGDADECASIISAPAECVVSSSVVQGQKNTTMTLVPGPLINCPPSDKSENTRVVVDVEKVAMEIDDDDDVDDRPLVLDLGDTVNTPSPAESPAPPVVIVSEEAPGTFRRPPPPPKASPRSTPRVSSVASTTSTTVTITSTPAHRVQKPIRPFIPQHFNSLEGSSGSHVSTTVPVNPTSVSHHLTAPSLAATTIRLQTLSSQPPPLPPPPGPSTPSAAASPQQTNGVQFMSVLTPPPSVSSAISPSPIHLFNLAAMPGYLNAASGVLFQSIPSTTVTTGGGGGGGGGGTHTTGPGGFQFTPPPPPPPPPPPLFAPQAFPPPHFARPPSNLSATAANAPTAGSLPPPPPLAPAPGLTSVQPTSATRTPVTGLFIPDMSTWMATVTGAQSIPPLQPLFSAQPTSLTTATISSGEVIYSTVVTAVTTTPTTTVTTTSSSSSVPSRLTTVQSSPSSLTSTTSLKTDGEKSLTPTPMNGGATTPFASLSISARRWRPSLGRKCSVAANINSGITIPGMCSSKTTFDKALSTVVSPPVAASTTTVSMPSAAAVVVSSSANSSVTTMEALVSKTRNTVHGPSRKRLHEESATRRRDVNASMAKSETMDSALPKEEKVEDVGKEAKVKNRAEVFSPPLSTVSPLLPPLPPPPPQSKSRTHPPKRAMQPPLSPAPSVAQFTAERKIISHFIDGHVLYESNLPFPVRNAMAVVRATLKCNGDAKSHEIVSTESVHITNHDQGDANCEESKPNGAANGEHLPHLADSGKTIHRKHSAGLLPGGYRKRRLSKSEVSRSCDTEKHVEAETEDAVMEKKRSKKTMAVYDGPFVALDDGAVPMSTENGHKEVPVSGEPLTTNSKTKGEEGRTTVPTSAKTATAANLSLPTSSVATASVSEPATMTTATTNISTGGGGSGLKMTIHPVYQTVSRTSTPTVTLSATTSSLSTKSAPTPPPLLPVVSTPSSSTILTAPQPLTSPTLRTHPTSIAKPPISTTLATTVTNIASSCSGGGSSARLQQLPPPLRKPMKSWSPTLVAEFVRGTPSCSTYADAFVENEIDGEALLLLTPAHFIDEPIKMKIGHALKLAHRVRQIVDPTYDSSASAAPIGGGSAGGAV